MRHNIPAHTPKNPAVPTRRLAKMNKNSDTDNDDPTPVADRLPFPTDEDTNR